MREHSSSSVVFIELSRPSKLTVYTESRSSTHETHFSRRQRKQKTRWRLVFHRRGKSENRLKGKEKVSLKPSNWIQRRISWMNVWLHFQALISRDCNRFNWPHPRSSSNHLVNYAASEICEMRWSPVVCWLKHQYLKMSFKDREHVVETGAMNFHLLTLSHPFRWNSPLKHYILFASDVIAQ